MTIDNTEEPEVTPSLLVRSAIHLPEIGIGALIYVDPRVPYIAGCLDRGFLVAVEAEDPPTTVELRDVGAQDAPAGDEALAADDDVG